WTALLVAATGIADLAGASPAELAGRRGAGGAVGAVIARPLVAGVGVVLAATLLWLVAFFGVLVVTATPLNQVPTRLRELPARLLGRPVQPDPDEAAAAGERTAGKDIAGKDIAGKDIAAGAPAGPGESAADGLDGAAALVHLRRASRRRQGSLAATGDAAT